MGARAERDGPPAPHRPTPPSPGDVAPSLFGGRAEVRGIELQWEAGGSGPPVLFISGTGADLRAPDTIRPLLRSVTRALAFDQRNLGRSTIVDGPATMADYADEAAALVDAVGPEALGTNGPVAVVGLSFGGMVAQELALGHPRVVSRLALVATTPGGAGASSYPLHTLEPLDTPEAEAVRTLELADVRLDAPWRAAHPGRTAALVADVLSRRAIGGGDEGRAVGVRRQLEARAGHDTWDRLGGLDLPVLVQAGRFDGIAAPEAARRLADRIPGARWRRYDGGHLFLATEATARSDLCEFLTAP